MVTVQKKDLGEKKTKELVKEFMAVDILMAVSSPILSLAMFLMPQSGVLEVLPRYQPMAQYSRFVYGLDLLYYSHHQLERSIFETGNHLQKATAYVDKNTMWQYLLDLCHMVRHNKYHH